jgi:hypothetical protein
MKGNQLTSFKVTQAVMGQACLTERLRSRSDT